MANEPHKKLFLRPISAAAPGTLYQQIVDGVKREISEGRLAPGAPLPSFRALAEKLLVSVITVKRAYEELEREGIIYRKQGLGTFVSEEGAARSREAKRAQAAALIAEALREGREAGMSDEELLKLVYRLLDQPEALKKQAGNR
jgi:GntR family transcriptional regulator